MGNNKNLFIVGFLVLSILVSSCTNTQTQTTSTTDTTSTTQNSQNTQTTTISNETSTSDETQEVTELSTDDINYSTSDTQKITLNGDNIKYSGDDATVDGTTITITSAGNYEISGELKNGQIIVETEDKEAVNIILNGVEISNSTSNTIYVKNAKQTVITLAEGTTNTLSDASEYTYAEGEDEPNATIFSKDDLFITGEGSLNVTGNYNDAIASKDSLVIFSGNITVTSKDDGIRGKDYLQIDGGNIKVTTEGDSLKADNEEGGVVVINGGTIEISSGDDAVHAEISLTVNGGTINVTKSYEGLESKEITINGGDINIVSSDDGINAAGGSSSESGGPGQGGRMGGFGGESSSSYYIYINGGNINVNASGDGLDANGSIIMTGGNVVVAGPTSNGNGSLDYDREFTISGGTLIAAGSSGMVQNISDTSTQSSILIGFDSSVASDSNIEVKNSDGNSIYSYTTIKSVQAFLLSSEDLIEGETYTYYVNGEETGTFTIEDIANSVGNIKAEGGMGGGMGGGMRGGRGMRGDWNTDSTTGEVSGDFGERPERGDFDPSSMTPPDGMTPPDMTQETES